MSGADVVRRVYDLFEEGRIDAIPDLLADDFHWEYVGPEELPWAGTYVGRAGVERFFALVGDLIEVEKFTVLDYIESGDRVVTVGTSEARILANGARYKAQWINIFTLDQGRIAGLLDLYDTGSVLAALRGER